MTITTRGDVVDADTFGCMKQVVPEKQPERGFLPLVVKFQDTVQVRATRHSKSDQQILEEKIAKWYSQHELLKMRKQHVQSILSLDSVSDDERKVLKNLYGLDSVESRKIRKERIRSVRLAVLQEQERQWDLQSMDEKNLATISHLSSIKATKEAQLRGIQLMRDVVRDTIIQEDESGRPILAGRAKTLDKVFDCWSPWSSSSSSSSPPPPSCRHPTTSLRTTLLKNTNVLPGRSSSFFRSWTTTRIGEEDHGRQW